MEYNVFTIHWVSTDINSPLQPSSTYTAILGMEYNLCLFAFSIQKEIKCPFTPHSIQNPIRSQARKVK